ncbi:hypothetical protein LTR46_005191 [Exophiala xenobiotica]|nr:hypothetical protein LTR18_001437 [Exophiala xenobiotica]KAK5556679.1 hypothetical protein LTR46_005191 [Exophiala xenobiotica]
MSAQVKAIQPPRSTTTSRAPSVFSAVSIDTLVGDSDLGTPPGYRGFPSRQAYLEALREWAEEKMYYRPTEQLHGFYGNKTVDEILNNQGGKIPTSRRATVAQAQAQAQAQGGTGSGTGTAHDEHGHGHGQPTRVVTEQAVADKENTANRLKKVFSRRKSTM